MFPLPLSTASRDCNTVVYTDPDPEIVTFASSVTRFSPKRIPDPERTYLAVRVLPLVSRFPDPDIVTFTSSVSITPVFSSPDPEIIRFEVVLETEPVTISPDPLTIIRTSSPSSGPAIISPDPALTSSSTKGDVTTITGFTV